MADADYRLCDVCGCKAFYDSNLSYEFGPGGTYGSPPYKEAGKQQYQTQSTLEKHGVRLGFLGDWAVLCVDCAKTHRTQIVPIEATASKAQEGRDKFNEVLCTHCTGKPC